MADKQPATASATEAPKGPKAAVQLGGESITERLLPHVKKIALGLAVVAAILTVIFTIRWAKQRSRGKATAKIAQVMQVAATPLDTPPNPMDPDAANKPKGKTFPNRKDRAQAALDKLAQTGANVPAVVKGGLYADVGKYDDAIAAFKAGEAESGIAGVLAREGEGLAIEAKAEAEKDAAARQTLLEQALAVFTAMQPDAAGDRYAYALYHQARIQALLGKNAEAKAAFEKAAEAGKGTALPALIDDRLADLEAHP